MCSSDLVRLESTLGDLARHTHTPVRFVAITPERLKVVDAAAVDWIEASENNVRLHTASDSALIRETMMSIAERLDPAEFVRVHRSTIVRLARIRELAPMETGDYKLFLTTGATLTLGRAYRDDVIARMNG